MTEEQEQLIQSVVDFTGTSRARAEQLLKESNWDVPEAVSRFFHESEAATAYANPPIRRRGGGIGLLLHSILEAIKSCMGWSWSFFRLFMFGGPSSIRAGSGNLSSYFNTLSVPQKPNCFEGSFKEVCTLARQRDNRKVVVVYLHTQSSPDFQASVDSVLLDESFVSMINAQFLFWAADTEFVQAQQLLRALPIRTTPLLIALVSQNATEIRIVGACGGAGYSLEGALNLLQKAQEEQDRLMAEDEQFKINRSLREAQDREYEEALERDRETERIKTESAQAESDLIREKAELEARLDQRLTEIEKEWFAPVDAPIREISHIVVKLPSGKRIEQKFVPETRISIVYEWVTCQCRTEIGINSSFILATSFPTIKLDVADNKTLEELGLVPNAVLLCSVIDK